MRVTAQPGTASVVACALAALVIFCEVVPATAASYHFEAKYTAVPPTLELPYTMIPSGAPAINNAGLLAFATKGGPEPQQPIATGLLVGDGGSPELVAIHFDLNSLALNNSGQLAYLGADQNLHLAVLRYGSGSSQVIAGAPDYGDFNATILPPPLQINDAGQVLFDAGSSVQPSGRYAFVSDGITTTPIMRADYGEAINNLGVVAISTLTQIVAVPPVGPTTVLITSPPAGYAYIGYMQTNDVGDLLTVAYNGGNLALFKYHNGVPTLMTDDLTTWFDINNSGAVAFLGKLNGITGIYTGPNSIGDRVVAIGDPLFGSSVTNLRFGGDGLNDLGQLGFYYELANGEHGVAMATPVPEPSTVALAAMALFATAAYTRYRRRVESICPPRPPSPFAVASTADLVERCGLTS